MNEHLAPIEDPFKFALRATAIFTATSALFGIIYRMIAIGLLGISSSRLPWDDFWKVSDFSVEHIALEFTLYFLCFLVFTYYRRTNLFSAPIGIPILTVGLPIGMTFFSHSMSWILTSILFSLMFFGVSRGKRYGGIVTVLLILIFVVVAYADGGQWFRDIVFFAKESSYGESGANEKAWLSLVFFAPVYTISLGVKYYLIYTLPQNFFRAARGA